MILLTSFFKCPKGIKAISVARYQPTNFHLSEIRFLAPIDNAGKPLKYQGPVDFRNKYIKALKSRRGAVEAWLASLDRYKPLALCCWCTIEQQRRKGKEFIACHTLLLGEIIQKKRPDIFVFVDEDRFEYSYWSHCFQLFDRKRFEGLLK